MKSNTLITLCFLIVLILTLVIKSNAQVITLKDYQSYIDHCNSDSTEIREIGVIEKIVTRQFAGYYGEIATWNAVMKTDTTWYNEETFGYWANPDIKIIYRRVWVKREKPTFEGFYQWIKK